MISLVGEKSKMPLRGFGEELLGLPQKAVDATRECIADDYWNIVVPLTPVVTGRLLRGWTREDSGTFTCIYNSVPYAAVVDKRTGATDMARTLLTVRYNLLS